MGFLCDERRRQINQWGKTPRKHTPSCVHSQYFAISRAGAGAEEHSQGTGYPALSRSLLELRMFCSGKSLLCLALAWVLLAHLHSQLEGKCGPFCWSRRDKGFPFPRPYLGMPCGEQPTKRCVRGSGWVRGVSWGRGGGKSGC